MANRTSPTGGLRTALAAGVAGALCIAFSGIYVRLAEVAPATAAVFRCAYAVPALALLAARERRRFGPRTPASRRLALAAGVFFALDLLFWHTAIDYVGAGLATVLANLQVVLVALVAWAVLGERPHARVLAAVPVVLLGVVAISGVVGEGAYGDNPRLGAAFGVLTAIAYAGFFLTLRAGNADIRRPAGPLLDATATAAVTSALVGLAIGDVEFVPSWPEHGWLLALALKSQVVGWLLISISLPRLPAAVTSVLLMLQPTTAVLLGMVLLGESPSALQLGGVAVVVAGVALAATARQAPGAPAGAPRAIGSLSADAPPQLGRQGPDRRR